MLYTVDEVAAMWKMSRSTIYAMKKKIGYLKIGGAVRFRQEDLDRFQQEVLNYDTPTAPKLPVTRRKRNLAALRKHVSPDLWN